MWSLGEFETGGVPVVVLFVEVPVGGTPVPVPVDVGYPPVVNEFGGTGPIPFGVLMGAFGPTGGYWDDDPEDVDPPVLLPPVFVNPPLLLELPPL